MKKSFVQIVSVVLAVIMIFPAAGLAAENKEYVIVSPYADVVWEGDGAWEAYKGNLHTHSFVSDANVDYRDMILEYYRQGFDFLAMTDHGVTGKEWNKEPTKLPLYAYQGIIGNKINFFSDEEYAALTSGAYPADETGAPRGNGMTCVTGGNELNALTLTKSHVNAIFLPVGVGNNHLGFENDFEGAVKLADKAGAVSFINHPGDWIGSGSNRALSSDPEKSNIFRISCLGTTPALAWRYLTSATFPRTMTGICGIICSWRVCRTVKMLWASQTATLTFWKMSTPAFRCL